MDELTTPVREQHKLDVARLLSYLSANLQVSSKETLAIRQYRYEFPSVKHSCGSFEVTVSNFAPHVGR